MAEVKINLPTPTTVMSLVKGIDNGEYIIPAIQRKFVWRTEQITKLFDSLMLGYPVGTLLIWKTKRGEDDHFYNFIKDYSEYDDADASEAPDKKTEIVQAILDGQQRMNSLYIGLMGSYAEKIRYKPKGDKSSYPKKHLYVNLLKKNDTSDNGEIEDNVYDFQFLTKEQAAESDDEHYWFRVGRIIEPELNTSEKIFKYMDENCFPNSNKKIMDNSTARNVLFALFNRFIDKDVLNTQVIESDNLDDALNIFIRVNKNGKPLSPGDLCQSYLVAKLGATDDKLNIREKLKEFVHDINNIGGTGNFKFDKDWVLKTFLFLSSDKFSLKTNSFDKNNIDAIKGNFETYLAACKKTVELISSFGFNSRHFLSNNSLLPIAYYICKRGYCDSTSLTRHGALKKRLRWWFILSNLYELFGSRSDDVLKELRKVLDDNAADKFPLSKMIGVKKEVTVESIIDFIINYKENLTVMALSAFYEPEDTVNQVDHIYPKSKFRTEASIKKLGVTNPEDIKFYMEHYDTIGNLEFLPQNTSKGNKLFDEWLDAEFKDKPTARTEFITKHRIPDCDCSFGNFREFLAKREEKIREKELKDII